jgi:nucleoside-diphosphate-sugar epimerase
VTFGITMSISGIELEVACLVAGLKPDAIVHTAAQPSHDLAASRPFDDFDVNAVGTLNLLEAVRLSCPESPFVHMSTNKVYGDAPNRIDLVERETRWDYADVVRRKSPQMSWSRNTVAISKSLHVACAVVV